jgi:hypothetical protein
MRVSREAFLLHGISETSPVWMSLH